MTKKALNGNGLSGGSPCLFSKPAKVIKLYPAKPQAKVIPLMQLQRA